MKEKLFALQDPGYRDFQAKLMPTVDKARIIGVRTPALRSLAKTLRNTPEAESFLNTLPHDYYEENNLHAFLLVGIQDFDQAVAAVDAFLPYIDNWATCDSLRPKIFARHKAQLLPHIRRWLDAEHTYTVRFGLEMLLCHYLDEAFQPEYLTWAAEVQHEDYYVRMMVAWYFAEALAKQYDAALPYLTRQQLPRWTHNKAIQKAVESFRIPDARKAHLRTLRRK